MQNAVMDKLLSLNSFPAEILIHIVSYCTYDTIVALKKTCRSLNNMCKEQSIWINLIYNDFGINLQAKPKHFNSYQNFYECYLLKYAHLLGTFKASDVFQGGLIETHYDKTCEAIISFCWRNSINDPEIGNKTKIFDIIPEPSLNGKHSFKVACQYGHSTGSHEVKIRKDTVSRNYDIMCKEAVEHLKKFRTTIHSEKHYVYELYFNDAFSTGIGLVPIILPKKSSIPLRLLNKDGSIPLQIIEPGVFKVTSQSAPAKFIAFHYKNEFELHGTYISLNDMPFNLSSIRVFLNYPCIVTDDQQASIEGLKSVACVKDRNFEVKNCPRGSFVYGPFRKLFDCIPTQYIARYHGKGLLECSGMKKEFGPVHFIVFDNDTLGIINLEAFELIFFKRMKHEFSKCIPQRDLLCRAINLA